MKNDDDVCPRCERFFSDGGGKSVDPFVNRCQNCEMEEYLKYKEQEAAAYYDADHYE